MKHLKVLVAAFLCTTAGIASAAGTTVNVSLNAQPSQTTLPDGAVAKMWQFCGAVASSTSTCSATQWAPGPTITVSASDTLNIALTNNLQIPTSIVVLGQPGLGGGLGSPTPMAAPIVHAPRNDTTFPATGGTVTPAAPPPQVARVQSFGTQVEVGQTTTLTWTNLKPGTYIYQSGTLPSLQVPMGLYGLLVVTKAPQAADSANNIAFKAGAAYPAFGSRTADVGAYDSDIALLFSEIDPVQNAAVELAASNNAAITRRFDDPACTKAAPCYPPAVNYTPTYFLINGKPFDPAKASLQSYAAGAIYSSGNLLLRLANAGSRLHVPAAVGLPFQLLAEDGNLAPGKIKVQNEVSLSAGKTQDVLVTPANTGSAYKPASFALFDRQLSTATSGSTGGMQAFLQIAGAVAPSSVTPTLVADSFKVPYNTSTNGNVKLNDIAVAAVSVKTGPTNGTLQFDPSGNGDFIYTPNSGFSGTDTFVYQATNTGSATATVTLTVGAAAGKPIAANDSYFSSVLTQYKSGAPGLLANDTDAGGKADRTLKVVVPATAPTCGGGTVDLHADGSFVLNGVSATATNCSFSYQAKNSQGTLSNTATVTVNFGTDKTGTIALKKGLKVDVVDAKDVTKKLTDYRWLVQEDLTFKVDPSKTPSLNTRTIGTSFHRSHMTVVASGCVGAKSCGSGQAIRVDDTTIDATTSTKGARHIVTDAEALARSVGLDKVLLDPSKNYYISILPGDALDDAGGHLMGGVAVSKNQVANVGVETLIIKTSATAVNPGQLSVFIYEDNNATNNQYDTGEQGLGGFNIIVVDAVGRSGDPAGQQTYDMFGMPLSNALLGTPGCPDEVNGAAVNANAGKGDDGQNLVGVVYTCPNDPNFGTPQADALKYALAGHALIKYLEPARYDIIAHPAAWREAQGERWWQVETLEGTPAQDAFVGTNEPRYFQEFGPPGFHTSIGFVNPDHVTAYGLTAGVTTANDANHHSISGKITSQHMSRPSAVRLFDSGAYDLLSSTVCQVVVNSGGGTGPAIAITECDADGSFTISGIPDGSYEIQIWDRWLDQIIQAQAVTLAGDNVDLKNVPVLSWFTQHDQNMFLDLNGNGRYDGNEPGIANLLMTNRYRNGSISNQTLTDSFGNGILVELFPLFNWYVSEADTTRFKQTGVNVVVDGGGPVNNAGSRPQLLPDGTTTLLSGVDKYLINSTYQAIAQGDTGCNPDRGQAPEIAGADCTADHTTDRIEIPGALSYGIQGFISQRNRIDWGRAPYVSGENGGIAGTVVYSSTRPFDDQRFNIQNIWAPLVPRVTVNLYKKQVNADGSESKVLVDSTKTSSWDDWVQTVVGSDGKSYMLDTDGVGLRDPLTGLPVTTATAGKQLNIQCPGQRFDDAFVTYTLGNQNPGTAPDQFRCYDGFHVWNQVQSAPYDGRYQFPSPAYVQAHKGDLPVCNDKVTIGTTQYPNPNTCQTLVSLPPGDYIVEAVTPEGYEIVKEEDKNIFTGDQFNGPKAQQLAGLGNIFILPDQATLNNANPYNARNGDGVAINATNNLGNTTTAGYTVAMPECVGDLHRVPDYLSIFPQAQLVAPFAGQDRPLCDRKLVKLKDQSQVNANFFIFTPVPLAANGAGIILDDAASEFNAASPDFGEKAAVPFVPVSVKDFSGTELTRTYADQWGAYNLMYPSSWTVNPPTPSGYLPNMLVNCMNDPGPIDERDASGNLTGRKITDPQFNAAYSNFCYTLPFMPGQTTYLDTPVLPVAAFAQGPNPADCEYPDSTPAIKSVNSSKGFGPYLEPSGGTLTINAVGDRTVPNPAYSGPFATGGIASQRTLNRHYGFGTVKGTVSIGGVTLPDANVSWADQKITATVPANFKGGQLVVTTFGGKSSIDGVTVTIEDKKPTRVDANLAGGATYSSIQAAIDNATPGDLILVNEGTYNELVVMWKPVRLQGTGGASVYINATKYPTSKLAAWRPVINAAFGVDINTGNNVVPAQVDALPTQEITGGIVLLEPSVLGSEEGPGIAVLAKGINDFVPGLPNAGGPLGTSNAECGRAANGRYTSVTVAFDMNNGANTVANPGLSNFACAPSRIDGVGITGGDSGGGIYVNGWAHNLEIANNRVFGNAGAYNGGIRIGVPYLELEALPDATGNTQPGFGYDKNIKIHHNFVAKNGTVEAPVGAGGAGGGVSICTGTDGYSVDHNWICGNYSSSDGGGIGHIGFSQGGTIAYNQILFNESTQQTSAVSGGGIAVVAEPIIAGNLALGTGSVTIDANVIRGNLASGGKGGGIFLSGVNGLDVGNNPNNKNLWFTATVTNNIIDNNVAGWAGGGFALFDTLLATIDNNTIASNDSVGVAGVVLANGVGKPEPAGLVSQANSAPLSAALATAAVTPAQKAISSPTLVNNIVWKNRSFYYGGNNKLCAGNGAGGACTELPAQAQTGQCVAGAAYWDLGLLDDANPTPGLTKLNPVSSIITSVAGYTSAVTSVRSGNVTAETVLFRGVTLAFASPQPFSVGEVVTVAGIADGRYNGTFTITAATAFTISYTDNNFGPFVVTASANPGTASITTVTTANNLDSDPLLVDLYCNGSRIVPELDAVINPPVKKSYAVAATSDEGNNYVSVKYGPLYMENPVTGAVFGDLHLAGGSPAIDSGAAIAGLTHDVDGQVRPQGAGYDRGADEFVPAQTDLAITKTDGVTTVTPNMALTYTIVVTNNGPSAVTGATVTDNLPAQLTAVTWTCAASAGSSCASASGSGNIGAKVNLALNGTATFTVKATVSGTATTGNLTNTATVAAPAGVVDTNTANNTATDTDSIVTPTADLSITKTDGVNSVNAGSAVNYTITVANAGPFAVTGATVNDTMSTKLGGVSWTCATVTGGSCGSTNGTGSISGALVNLNVGGSVKFTVTATVSATATGALVNTATVAVPAGYTDPNTGNNSATDTDIIVPNRPTLTVLDPFNRANAANLGSSWDFAVASITVNSNQAFCTGLSCVLGGTAYWNGGFGTAQAAALTIANATINGDGVLLKVGGGSRTVPTSWVRVRVNGGNVTVDTTTNGGLSYGNSTNLAASFANGNTLEALIDDTGTVYVWKVAGTTTTLIGSASTGTNFTGNGRIGLQLPSGARVDDFAGGSVP
jgi:uncharacterized repeat protein (TIGR01451 family)